jgi:hypothetical protein
MDLWRDDGCDCYHKSHYRSKKPKGMSFSFFLNLSYLIDRMRIIYYNVTVDVFLSRLGVLRIRPSI